jgi:hypothetical protein
VWRIGAATGRIEMISPVGEEPLGVGAVWVAVAQGLI